MALRCESAGPSATPDVTTYAYNDAGSRQSVTYPNGVTTRYQYDDDLGRLSAVEHRDAPQGSVLRHYAYSLATDGKRLAVHERDNKPIKGAYPL